MGKHTFTWYVPVRPSQPRRALTHPPREHDAQDVYVTGTFDNWQKTVQLEKEDGIFKKTVELPQAKHQYKVRTWRPAACAWCMQLAARPR